MTQQNLLPEYIDIEKWREQGYKWEGAFDLADFPRLAEMVRPISNSDNISASLGFSVFHKSGVTWLSFVVKAHVELDCQRCLLPMEFIFQEDNFLALLDDESQSNLLEEDSDWVIITEVAERVGNESRLPISTIIEDELLLQIPTPFKHEVNEDVCVPVDFIEEDDVEIQENPFGALAGLSKQLKGDS